MANWEDNFLIAIDLIFHYFFSSFQQKKQQYFFRLIYNDLLDYWQETLFDIVQVNLCQTHLFLHRLTHNMTTDCSLNYYQFSTWKFQALRTCFVHKLFWQCSELGIFMYWTGNSMDNLLSYCGLVDARISTSENDLPETKSIYAIASAKRS